MKVERIDVFDFRIVFDEADFVQIVSKSTEENDSVEEAIEQIIEYGFERYISN